MESNGFMVKIFKSKLRPLDGLGSKKLRKQIVFRIEKYIEIDPKVFGNPIFGG